MLLLFRYVDLSHTKDGNLETYLHSNSEDNIGVHYGFTLVNFEDEKKLRPHRWRRWI